MKKLVYFVLGLLFLSDIIFSEDFQLQKLPTNVNTNFDEYPCFVYDNKLFFIRKEPKNFAPYLATLPSLKEILPFEMPKNYFKENGSFFSMFKGDTLQFFAFAGKNKKKNDIDIFIIEQNNFSKKANFLEFPYNSELFQSHPQFSKDGKFLIFSAESPQKNTGTDLFLLRFENGSLGDVQDIPTVNSLVNEITPSFDDYGNIYFARFDSTNYNIYFAPKIDSNIWGMPRKLPFPINTEYNELSPVIYNNTIYFASDRETSSKGFDIYSASLCLPVVLEVDFQESIDLFSSFDKIAIFKENGDLFEEKYLGVEAKIRFKLEPRTTYKVNIYNECTNEIYFSKVFSTQCIDSSYLVYKIPLLITNNLTKEINIPFFVTGYYKPITKRNLTQLKELFDYNFIGNNDSTSFIEYPSQLYFDVSESIEKVFEDIVNHIEYFANIYKKGCISKNKILKIETTGYADPRQLSPTARFFEETIDDQQLHFYLERGTPLNNDILSKLRAYYTAKEILDKLKQKVGVDFLKNYIRIEIKNGGTISEEEDYLLLRKVNIKISFEEAGL